MGSQRREAPNQANAAETKSRVGTDAGPSIMMVVHVKKEASAK